MQRVKLTSPFIKSIADKAGTHVADTIVTHLQIWIGKRSATFYLVMKHDGRSRNLRIGAWPRMQAEEARIVAEKKIASILNMAEDDDYVGRMITLGEALDEYLDDKDSKSSKAHTKCILNRWAPLRHLKLSAITREDVIRVMEESEDTPVAANRALKYLKAAISDARRRHRLSFPNQILDIRMYKESPRERYMTREEGVRFIKAAAELEKESRYFISINAILMMLYTGARRSNVLQMRFDEINGLNIWTIPAEKFKNKAKSHSIMLGSRELEIIEKMRPYSKKGFVFERDGKPFSEVKHTMTTLCNLANIKGLHLHDLRRTLGTWMLSSGTPIAVVSKKLGHSSIRITEQVYAHMLPDVAKDATEKALDEMLGDTGKQ